MATTTQTTPLLGAAQREARQRRRRLLIGGTTLAVMTVGGWLLWNSMQSAAQTVNVSTVPLEIGTLTVSVAGSGTVEALQSRTLSFGVDGTISDVAVSVGERVTAGQQLARLDTRKLELSLRQAAASLKAAEAALQSARGESTDTATLAAAQAQYDSAVAQHNQSLNGDATAAQLASAQANLASAQANLADLLDGPTAQALLNAQTAVEDARGNLSKQQTALAAARLKAENSLTTTANALRDAQQDYSDVYWAHQTTLQRRDLNDNEISNERSALRAVENAEISLQNAQLNLEQAQRDEVIGVEQATADLRSAELALQTLTAGPTATELAAARASVTSAEAGLQALTSPATANDRVIAEANLTQARLNYESVSTPADTATLANAEAGYLQAQVAYEQAQLNLADAVLIAPFDGVAATVEATVGDSAAGASIRVLDISRYAVELSLSETDVANVTAGQPVGLAFDALPDLTVDGTVETVAPAAEIVQNVATYAVRVVFDAPGSAVRAGMSSSGAIRLATSEGALLVATRALVTTPEGMLLIVQADDGSERRVPVQIGMAANGKTEIISCIETGDRCLTAEDTAVVRSTTTDGSSSTPQFGPGSGMGPGSGGFAPGGRP